MDDLIKRSDAIEAIEEVDWYHQNRNKDMVSGANSDEHQAWYKEQDIYKALEEVPSADRPQGEWIPCSERLPEKQTTVLYSLEGCVSVAFMTDRNYTGETVELHWEDLETGITIYPEAWMPLPKPWKGADDEH